MEKAVPLRRAVILWTDPKLVASRMAHVVIRDEREGRADEFVQRNYPYTAGATYPSWRRAATLDDLWEVYRLLVQEYNMNPGTLHQHFTRIKEWREMCHRA